MREEIKLLPNSNPTPMHNHFVPYDIAIEFYNLGFDDDCICGFNSFKILKSKVSYATGFDCECKWDKYDNEIRSLLWQQAIDWFRTKYDIHIGLTPYTNPAKGIVDVLYEYTISTKENSYEGGIENSIARLQEGLETKKTFIHKFI